MVCQNSTLLQDSIEISSLQSLPYYLPLIGYDTAADTIPHRRYDTPQQIRYNVKASDLRYVRDFLMASWMTLGYRSIQLVI